ncbi:hypothetical protein [Belnapia moabensis]|uniref:hypothetical protein n=1 Tax=Belnapia moabensis TaxID=365533 RepID=UPI0012ED1D7B|nr:hypothetical protein [Belnapia moabensis]
MVGHLIGIAGVAFLGDGGYLRRLVAEGEGMKGGEEPGRPGTQITNWFTAR